MVPICKVSVQFQHLVGSIREGTCPPSLALGWLETFAKAHTDLEILEATTSGKLDSSKWCTRSRLLCLCVTLSSRVRIRLDILLALYIK